MKKFTWFAVLFVAVMAVVVSVGGGCTPAVPSGDSDGDGVTDDVDNCPTVANADQADADGDGIGDACEADTTADSDGDGVADDADNCPNVANADQADADGDGVGDACEADSDGDGIADDVDNCPNTANADQTDADMDGVGDACDATAVSFSNQIQPIFDANCTVCHVVGGIAEFTGQLLTAEESFDAIVNQPSFQSSFIRVVPGDSSASLLFLKVSSNPPPVGSRMPLGGAPLSDADIALIRDWIDQGAANN